MKEADIIIEGRKLSFAESMTVRVALTNYIMEMDTNGLGDDEHGKFMANAYATNARTVIDTILKGCQ